MLNQCKLRSELTAQDIDASHLCQTDVLITAKPNSHFIQPLDYLASPLLKKKKRLGFDRTQRLLQSGCRPAGANSSAPGPGRRPFANSLLVYCHLRWPLLSHPSFRFQHSHLLLGCWIGNKLHCVCVFAVRAVLTRGKSTHNTHKMCQ